MESTRSKIVAGVILAIVGAAVSTFAGWIPNPFAGSTPLPDAAAEAEVPRTLLVIEGVESFGRSPGEVKVVALVNGTAFEYPSLGGVEWLEVGPSMSSQSFLLPAGVQRVELRFEMRTRSGESYLSQRTDTVDLRDGLPHTGTYNLHLVNDRSRAAAVSAGIRYRLVAQP